jgi:hypothetical protein
MQMIPIRHYFPVNTYAQLLNFINIKIILNPVLGNSGFFHESLSELKDDYETKSGVSLLFTTEGY